MEDLKRSVYSVREIFVARDLTYYMPGNESGILKAKISVSRLAYERNMEKEKGRDNKTETKKGDTRTLRRE